MNFISFCRGGKKRVRHKMILEFGNFCVAWRPCHEKMAWGVGYVHEKISTPLSTFGTLPFLDHVRGRQCGARPIMRPTMQIKGAAMFYSS